MAELLQCNAAVLLSKAVVLASNMLRNRDKAMSDRSLLWRLHLCENWLAIGYIITVFFIFFMIDVSHDLYYHGCVCGTLC
jgi:uncharacterized protein involved in response to NO